MKISKESSGINLVDSENSIIIWIFRVVSLFSYQGSALSLLRQRKILYQISLTLSTLFYFHFVISLSRQQITSYQIHLVLSRLFLTFLSSKPSRKEPTCFYDFMSLDKRRRRDLNPRAAINDLLPFQGSPFSHLGTSPAESKNGIHLYRVVTRNGEGGIRTHGPFRSHRFSRPAP